MWKYFVIIGLIATLSSCGAKREGVDASKDSKEIVLGKNEVVSYNSLGNGVAKISLSLYENDTFRFDFQSIPQPETDEKATIISEKGNYTTEGSWKILNFKDPNFSLSAIFDDQYADTSFFEVLDKENVKINISKDILPIWGVVCERQ
jgi:hypothetical protein